MRDSADGPQRHLDWDGCFNVRDLGGLPARGGTSIRRGALIRADAVDRLSESGWSSAEAHGVRTVIDLRNEDELRSDVAPRPASVSTLQLPLDGAEDREFWSTWAAGPQFGTPLYHRPHLDRFPALTVRVLAAIAEAPPGGVVVHCAGGRDRTGQVIAVVLALLGVPAERIAADYALSAERLRRAYEVWGEEDQGPELAAFLAAQGTTAEAAIVSMLGELDAEAWAREHGFGDEDLHALRARLLDR